MFYFILFSRKSDNYFDKVNIHTDTLNESGFVESMNLLFI